MLARKGQVSKGPKSYGRGEKQSGMLGLSPRWVCKIHTKVKRRLKKRPKFEMESGTENSQKRLYTTEEKKVNGNAIRTKAKVGCAHRIQQPQGKRDESYET